MAVSTERRLPVFGAPLNLAEEAAISRTLIATVGTPDISTGMRRVAERDLDLTRHRWSATRSYGGPFVAGDAIRFRGLAATWRLRTWQTDTNPTSQTRVAQVAIMLQEAVPYFVPAPTAWGMISQPLADEWISQLTIRHRLVYVTLGAPFEVGDEWLGAEDALNYAQRGDATLDEAIAGRPTPSNQLPTFIRFTTMQLARRLPVRLLGFVVASDPNGQLRDVLLVVTASTNSDDIDRVTVSEGSLSRAAIAPVVRQLLTVVAWGAWNDPSASQLDSDPRSKAFRRALRNPVMQAQEPTGELAGVHVLAAPKPRPPTTDHQPSAGGTHASPITHWRRPHPQRYRVGARQEWSYEIRWKPEQLINPDPNANTQLVYRLPRPPHS